MEQISEKIYVLDKPKSTMDRVTQYVLILVSALSLAGFIYYNWNINQYRAEIQTAKEVYEMKISRLDQEFSRAMDYDAATQNKVSGYMERHPDNALNVKQCVMEIKTIVAEERKKRKQSYQIY